MDRLSSSVAAPEMLDPKARVRTDDGGVPFEWMSVPSIPSVKEVTVQPATTDVLLQRAARAEKSTDTILTTKLVTKMILTLTENTFMYSFIHSFI